MSISIASNPRDVAACMDLRRVVFIQEQGVTETEEFDGEDDACRHVLLRDDQSHVATARFRYVDESVKIQRVCVLEHARGNGFGAEIIEFIINQSRAEGRVRFAQLGAQTQAIEFYEKLGFSAYGPEYMDANIPHRDMKMAL